jgi:hypothetical protein
MRNVPRLVGLHLLNGQQRGASKAQESTIMSTILLIILIVLLLGAIPAWPHSRGWGYYPSGGVGIVVVILLLLMVSGRI